MQPSAAGSLDSPGSRGLERPFLRSAGGQSSLPGSLTETTVAKPPTDQGRWELVPGTAAKPTEICGPPFPTPSLRSPPSPVSRNRVFPNTHPTHIRSPQIQGPLPAGLPTPMALITGPWATPQLHSHLRTISLVTHRRDHPVMLPHIADPAGVPHSFYTFSCTLHRGRVALMALCTAPAPAALSQLPGRRRAEAAIEPGPRGQDGLRELSEPVIRPLIRIPARARAPGVVFLLLAPLGK